MRLADIFDYLIDLAVALRTGLHHDVTGIHAETLDRHPDCIAGIPHTLQFIEIECAARRPFRGDKGSAFGLGGNKLPPDGSFTLKNHVRVRADMPDAKAQVVFEVFPGHDAATLGDVIVGAHVHEQIFPGNTGFLGRRSRNHWNSAARHTRGDKTTCKRFTEVPASHPSLPLIYCAYVRS